MSDPCPICGGSGCVTYPLMLSRWREGRDREHWRAIHDQMNGKAQYPSIATMAGNVIRAGVDFVASGFAVADEEEQARRILICHGCELFDHGQGRCTRCGCNGGWKAWVQSSHCPINKW